MREVFECTFWMQHHGSATPKPTVCFSNMMEIQQLNLGKLHKADRERLTTSKTVRSMSAHVNSKALSEVSTQIAAGRRDLLALLA